MADLHDLTGQLPLWSRNCV